ncbi:MAG: hypothetical protein M3P51_02835 [Chloroflexota bacterium]|nr:hypothetical protein [Chloroflexota bacterium]
MARCSRDELVLDVPGADSEPGLRVWLNLRMERIAVIADDLTGASDTGVQLARRGADVRVRLSLSGRGATLPPNIVVLDTDTRAVLAAAAYETVSEATRTLRAEGYTRLYKKLDSTLRGNVGAELDAVLDAGGYGAVLVAPAFPNTGRTTVGGRHLLHGTPVSETHLARDPVFPVRESHISHLLREQSRRGTGLVELATVRAGWGVILERVAQLRAASSKLIILDAKTGADLRAIAQAAVALRDEVCCAGSAGLAEALADEWLPAGAEPRVPVRFGGGPVLVVSGSASEVTREQVRVCVARPDTTSIMLDPALGSEEAERCGAEAGEALACGRDAILSLRVQEPGGVTSGTDSHRIVDMLGRAAVRAIVTARPGGLVLTGGDTARAVCQHIGAHSIRLLAELEPGVPLGELDDVEHLPVVTKAGAFGTPNTLSRALQALRGGGDG